MFKILKQTIREFFSDDCTTMAAALSYYTIFSLPPLLLLLLLLVGAFMDPGDVRGALETQLQGLMGPAAGEQVRTIIHHAERPGGGLVATLLGIAALCLGATGAFAQLQAAMNRAWGVLADPHRGDIRSFVMKRVFSFGMVLAVAFLLLVSLALSAILASLGDRLALWLPAGLSETTLYWLDTGISFAVIMLLFAAIFQVLPDAHVAWRDAAVGSAATALLFVGGKFLIGLYLGHSNPGEVFGAAGSLAVILLWIYYSSLIVLLGAEFTQAWAEQHGRGVIPEHGAVRIADQQPSSKPLERTP